MAPPHNTIYLKIDPFISPDTALGRMLLRLDRRNELALRLLMRVLAMEESEMSAIEDLVAVSTAAVTALRRLEDLIEAGQVDDPEVVAAVTALRAAVDEANTVDNDPANPVTPPNSDEAGGTPGDSGAGDTGSVPAGNG